MATLEEVRQVLTDLHSIARELNKPFDDGDVLGEYSKRNNGCSKEIAHYVIHPIYFPPEECIINNTKDTMTWAEVREFVKRRISVNNNFILTYRKHHTSNCR